MFVSAEMFDHNMSPECIRPGLVIYVTTVSARDVSQHVVCSCLTTLNKNLFSFRFITIILQVRIAKKLNSWLLMSLLSINDLFYRKSVIPHIFSSKKGKAKSGKWKKYKGKTTDNTTCKIIVMKRNEKRFYWVWLSSCKLHVGRHL
jgi:hypothetical protein